MEVFTQESLAGFGGTVPGRRILVAHAGWVYDVTRSFPWYGGRHWACARAGRDETAKFAGAPHGTEVLARVRRVGVLVGEE